jgi:predicted metalloprotease with PDZ domain
MKTTSRYFMGLAGLDLANGLFLHLMATRSTSLPTAPVHYSIDASDVHAHLYRVTLTIAKPAKNQQLSLPVWIPGSYMVREFSKHLQKLSGTQGDKSLAMTQTDKCHWQCTNTAAKPLVLTYEIYAYDNSVRTAWLDMQRGFFNGTSLCLRAEGQDKRGHQVHVKPIKSISACKVATGAKALKIDKQGFGTYTFTDYDELADTPFELGDFWRGQFTVRSAVHSFVVAGAPPTFDGKRLLADTQKIVEAEMKLWHGDQAKPPFENYVFMLNAVGDGYGGLEHRNSTALICTRRDLPKLGHTKASDGYITLLGLISHEYFHTWNVKRLRPAEFRQYDYSQEQYTQLLWFFEGFTSYYDDLLLRRAGLIDNAQYLKLLNKTINQVQQTPGAKVQSVAQSSFDAWVKYYRQDENTPNAMVSYYTKGALVALCFDLMLRSEGKTTLDHVMRAVWARCKAGPMTEADFAAVLAQCSGRSYAKELAQWVHSTQDLPLNRLLELQGVQVVEDKPQLAQRLGLRVTESQGVLQIKVVLRGGAAEQAGFCAGDEWLAVGTKRNALWRMTKLDDLPLYVPERAAKASTVQVVVSRDQRLHNLSLQLPSAEQPSLATCVLRAGDAARVNAWLVG